MSTNANLNKAKDAKNDEFYTQLSDVSKELMHYKRHFKDKTVLCNCDNPTWSAFWKYFHLNFSALGLKKLISTHYDKTQPTYKMEYTGGNDNDIEVGVKTSLEGNGDFRNQECLDILDEANIVVTNPPFSLFREYVAVLMEHEKKFLIIGNTNAITYKEFFPLLQNGLVWAGYEFNKTMIFQVGEGYKYDEIETKKINDGHKYRKGSSISWFTNLNIDKRHEPIPLSKNYKGNESRYPHYDNYSAIEVSKVSEIPKDYYGIMGVPITYLAKHCPEQFDIVGLSDADSPLRTKTYGDYIGYKQTGEKTGRTGSTFGRCPVLVKDDHKTVYYEKDGIRVQATYVRIFIRRKDTKKR